MIELGMAKYRDLSVSRRSIICRKLRLATDKSRYFAQPRPIIAYYFIFNNNNNPLKQFRFNFLNISIIFYIMYVFFAFYLIIIVLKVILYKAPQLIPPPPFASTVDNGHTNFIA